MNCETCKKGDTNCNYYEIESARAEVRNRRIIIALIIAIIGIILSNAMWLYAWLQYDYTSEEKIVTVETFDGGNASYIGRDGDIIYGESESRN